MILFFSHSSLLAALFPPYSSTFNIELVFMCYFPLLYSHVSLEGAKEMNFNTINPDSMFIVVFITLRNAYTFVFFFLLCFASSVEFSWWFRFSRGKLYTRGENSTKYPFNTQSSTNFCLLNIDFSWSVVDFDVQREGERSSKKCPSFSHFSFINSLSWCTWWRHSCWCWCSFLTFFCCWHDRRRDFETIE